MLSNCYLVVDSQSNQTLIIDPGDEADFIVRKIKDLELTPLKIIATHGHFDHIMAVYELQLAYSIPFAVHKEDEFLVGSLKASARHFLNMEAIKPVIDEYLTDGDVLKIGENKLTVIHTPGHTPGSVCLFSQKDKILFTGDLLFADGAVGRTDFSYSSPSDLEKSLAKIFQLDPQISIYPGHGTTSIIQREQALHTL